MTITIPSGTASPWARAPIRVFISHATSQVEEATKLRSALRKLGCDPFVAHRDIEAGTQWIAEIRSALSSCDALVALVSKEFKTSDWCEQEVGWALGRDVPCVPVRINVTPYGLLGTIQACNWPKTPTPAADLASEVLNILLNDERTGAKTVESLVIGLENAESFAQANAIARALVELNVSLTRAQLRRLKAAQKANSQVEGAYNVADALSVLAKHVSD